MASKRMFSLTVIDSDAFLDMPLSTQALYFHLCMRADDDGFVNSPKKIQRVVRAADDDLKMLIAKQFVIPFETGVVVIKHWKVHNVIRSDMYKKTLCKGEMSLIEADDTGTYQVRNEVVTEPVQDRTVDKIRLDKNKLDKDSEEKRKRFIPPTLEQVKTYCEERHNGIDPERFINFYESKGWMIGKNKMKDWKASVRSWERLNKEQENKIQERNKFNQFPQNDYDFEKLEKEIVGNI